MAINQSQFEFYNYLMPI